MSPELVQERPYDYTSDLWALGCILYELYAGQPPFYTNSIATLVKLVLRGNIKWPKGMSKELRTFLQGLLEKEISRRLKWPDLLHHPFLKKHIDFVRMREIGREGQEVANRREHTDNNKKHRQCRPPSRGAKPQTAPTCRVSQSGPIAISYTASGVDTVSTADDTPVVDNDSSASKHRHPEKLCEISSVMQDTPAIYENIESTRNGASTEADPNIHVSDKIINEYDSTVETPEPEKELIINNTEESSIKPDTAPEHTHSTNKSNSTTERTADVQSNTTDEIAYTQEQNKYNTAAQYASSSLSTEDTHVYNTDDTNTDAISSPVNSPTAVSPPLIPLETINTDPTANTNADNTDTANSTDTAKTDPPALSSQSAGDSLSPHKTPQSADSDIPRLDRYAQESSIYSDDSCPQYEYGTSHISPRRESNRKHRETTTSERSRALREQYTDARAKSANEKAAPKSRIGGLKSHSLNELLPARPVDKDRECFSRYETALSRIDSMFRLLIKYLLSLDVSFPLLHSWTNFYQILSPEKTHSRHNSDTNIMQDLEKGWEGTDLFLELTRDCLSKIRSDSPRLRSRAGERLNKLLTFQILVLVARETVPSPDMSEVVRRFGTEEVCAELMSVPLILSEGLSREQLMAVFLSHELFSLLTNCSRIEWGGRVRKKLDAITHLITRSLPQRRPPLSGPSVSSLLIAFYPLANSLVQEGFLRLEGLDIDAFIELNSRTLLSSLPPSPPFSPYVTTGYLDQVFIFLNHSLKQQRRHKTLLRILSLASSLFSNNCIRHLTGGSSAPLGQLLHPSLSPIALLEFLTLLRECLLRLSRESSSLQLLSCELLKELFISVSALLSTHTMDRLLDWYIQWLFLDYYTELVGLCVTGLSDLHECCVERGLHQWIRQRLLTSDLVPSLLRVAQFLLVTQPETDSFLPLLFLLSYCADTEETLSHLVTTLNLPEWSEVPYSLFSHLLEEAQREKELLLLLNLFLRIASLYQQREEQLVPSVLRLVSDRHSSDLNRFYQLLAHENKAIAMCVFKLVGLLIEQSQDSTISVGIASQHDLLTACVKLLSTREHTLQTDF